MGKKNRKAAPPLAVITPPTVGARDAPWALAILLALTALVYLPALQNDFVNWDDDHYVYANSRLRQAAESAVTEFFFDRDPSGRWTLPKVQGNYHPLTMLSLGFDLMLSGTDSPKRPDRETDLRAWVFHATNVALHLANTVLVFLFVAALLAAVPERHLGRGPRPPPVPVAFATALLFGIATLHVESVAWVAERKDVLYTFFFLLSLLLYVRYRQAPRRWPYVAALAAFLGALLSKGQAVTLAPTLVAVDLLFGLRPHRRRALAEKAPFFLLALLFGLIAVSAQMEDGNVLARGARYPPYLRPFFASYALVQYALKLAVPFHLLAYYPYSLALRHPGALYAVYFPLAAGMLGLAVYWIRQAPLYAFGLGFFLLNIATVLQLLPVGGAVMADRYSYVPSIGLFLLVALAGNAAIDRWPRHSRLVHSAFVAYVLLIGVATVSRVVVWRNSLTLWTDELTRNPDSALAYNNIATYRFKTGDLGGALPAVERAVVLDPEGYKPYLNRGVMRDVSGQTALARADYDRTLELQPNQPLALNNRGLIRQEAGDLPGALADFTKAIDLSPGSTKFYANRAKAEAAAGQSAAAMADYTRVLDRESDPELSSDRAVLRVQAGDLRGAIEDFSEVVRRLPDSPYPLLNRAKARIAVGDCAGAREDGAAAARLGEVPAPARAELDAKCPAR
jgi:protein O-mannosyl-transferase